MFKKEERKVSVVFSVKQIVDVEKAFPHIFVVFSKKQFKTWVTR